MLSTPSYYDLGIAVFVAVAGLLAATRVHADGWLTAAYILGGTTLTVFAFTVAKTLLQIRASADRESLHDLAGCLHTLRAVLLLGEDTAVDADPRLRLTVLAPTESGKELEQVLDYVGDPRGGRTAGRRFPVQSGISGKAYREKKAYAGTRSDNYDNYVDELVGKWAYTEQDARKLDQLARSWMAVPLVNARKEVEGVVYIDAARPNFFDEPVDKIVVQGCVGIALFASLRYD